jgi:hypothetical protein
VELPRLKPLFEKYRDHGLEIVVIDRSNDTEGALQFIEENELDYRFLENGEEDREIVKKVFGVRTFPTSYLINSDDRVLHAHIGFNEGDEAVFEEQIRELLELD